MTDEMKYGYGHGMQPGAASPPARFLAFVEKAERAGFDSFWLDDHLAFRGAYLESLCALAAAAARTRRITLGSLVYLLPLRRPAIAAKAAATVDYLSGGGRFIFGVGVGGEAPEEFDLCGVPRAERGRPARLGGRQKRSRAEARRPAGRRLGSLSLLARALWAGAGGDSPPCRRAGEDAGRSPKAVDAGASPVLQPARE